ncbi:hypothetical protein COY07_01440 [Candidatus Peregrinibacteria bacterium CG_4_10_14_0_2_um_filter_43_11]|nr:MAG: hypothetical protein COY07_01440 [Candidatus Peregrinibacteria bacterium CG_4_10_14_0_2_um_filter_43_11]
MGLLKNSFRFFSKTIHHYLILSIFVAAPILLIGGGFYSWTSSAIGTAEINPASPVTEVHSELAGEIKDIQNLDKENGFGLFVDKDHAKGLFNLDHFTSAMMIIFIVLSILFGFYYLITILAFLRLTTLLEHMKPIQYRSIIEWSIKKLKSYLMLLLRIFWYTRIWIVFVAMIIFTAFPFIRHIGGMIVILNFLSMLLVFAALIYVVIRGPYTIFAKYALVDRDENSKNALDESIHIAHGHWWKIVIYSAALSILMSVSASIVESIFSTINKTTGLVASSLFSLLIIYFGIIFYMKLYHGMKSASK